MFFIGLYFFDILKRKEREFIWKDVVLFINDFKCFFCYLFLLLIKKGNINKLVLVWCVYNCLFIIILIWFGEYFVFG